MFFRTKKSGPREYLQIVESYRDRGNVKQTVIATLGRLDVLKKDGTLDRLLCSGIRFSERLALIDSHKNGQTSAGKELKIGIPMIFGRLWEATGIKSVLDELLFMRRFRFPLDRAIFLTVLHRLVLSGSDRSAERWYGDYKVKGVSDISLHHLYRAMAWLGEQLPEEEQSDATPFAPRCTKDIIEEGLFLRRRDLFTDLTLVFFDTTSIYFEGNGGEELGRRGNSKEHRPDLKQLVVGVVLDQEGRPICCEIWPGNTTDVKTLMPVANRLRKRFGIGRICVVADRGMISKETIRGMEDNNMDYILGVRMRNQKEVREDVLSRAGRYREVNPKRVNKKAPAPLKVKEIKLNSIRYIVCYNEEQAKKDASEREVIIAALQKKLKEGVKTLIGNKGYRRYLVVKGEAFEIDKEKIKEEERYDGKWVLRTNTRLTAEQVALQYKQLWMVEQAFRTVKSVLKTRPVYHRCDETIRGHVFCNFLALILMKELQNRMDEKGLHIEWDYLIDDLDHLKETEIKTVKKDVIIRSQLRGDTGKVFQAVGVAIPPTVRILGDAPETKREQT